VSDSKLIAVLESVIEDVAAAVDALRAGERAVAAASLGVALERMRAVRKRGRK
jgi:hypothetical protein